MEICMSESEYVTVCEGQVSNEWTCDHVCVIDSLMTGGHEIAGVCCMCMCES